MIEHTQSEDGILRGIRCAYIRDNEVKPARSGKIAGNGEKAIKSESEKGKWDKPTASGRVPFWTEERQNAAYDRIVKRRYGELSGAELIRRREEMKKEIAMQGMLRRHAENEQRIMRETYFQRMGEGYEE